MLCSYGCNQEAIFHLKNGKWCCSSSPNSCPIKKKKNSDKLSLIISSGLWKPNGKPKGYKHKNPSALKGSTWDKIYGADKCIEMRKKASLRLIKTPITWSGDVELKRREKISTTMLRNKQCGGYRIGSGIGKKGWYKGYWCDSSYELAWIIYHIDHNIPFQRNTKKFPYIFENRTYNYIPDFLLNDGTYLEIKGFQSDRTNAKINQFPNQLKVVYPDDMKDILKYTMNKYGKDFINLYEEKRKDTEVAKTGCS